MTYQLTVAGSFNHPRLVPGETVLLVKEKSNAYDDEAIQVQTEDNQPRGYVAQTYKTRRKGTVSGSRLYDRLQDVTKAIVITEDVVEVEVL
ncbi:hypothetical protein D3C85_1432410 [compost metagenome]